MAAAADPVLMTVEQYRQLSDCEDVVQELHWGMVFTLTRPKMRHLKLQSRLVRLLRPKAEHLGFVETEVSFRALPEYDLRGADVAFVSLKRWEATDDDDNLHGSPELVIEVLSPSNTKAEIHEKAVLCLSTGAAEFWVVDPVRKTVSITPQGGNAVVYRIGERGSYRCRRDFWCLARREQRQRTAFGLRRAGLAICRTAGHPANDPQALTLRWYI